MGWDDARTITAALWCGINTDCIAGNSVRATVGIVRRICALAVRCG